jgi:hypothetical protein
MKVRRRETEVFSLSFLDCICCGFGAIILLLVLTDFDQPVVIERTTTAMEGQLKRLQEELYAIRGETDQLNRELQGRITDLTRERQRLVRVQGDLTNVRGQFQASRSDAAVANIVETELVSAYQELTAEMERLLKQPVRRTPPSATVGGIPVDSEYVIFVIDTSNSMISFHWEDTLNIMKEALDIYPDVKGLQVLNDQGRYLIDSQRGRWLPDTRAQRDRITQSMRSWRPYSESNPLPGIEAALRFRAPDRKISIYVIGDEFTGESLQGAMDSIDRLNAPDPARPRARIHTIGFQEGPGYPPFTNIRFSAVMRAISARNDGTFVGLTNDKPCRQFVEVLGTRQCISN